MSKNQDAGKQLPHLPEHVRKNRAMWEASSDSYDFFTLHHHSQLPL